MKSSVHKNMWKAEIMIGKYPAKTFAYKILSIRQEILSFFHILDNITFADVDSENVIKLLLLYSHMIDVIYEKVVLVNKLTSKKVNIKYERNNKFKFDILSDGNLITVKIPCDD